MPGFAARAAVLLVAADHAAACALPPGTSMQAPPAAAMLPSLGSTCRPAPAALELDSSSHMHHSRLDALLHAFSRLQITDAPAAPVLHSGPSMEAPAPAVVGAAHPAAAAAQLPGMPSPAASVLVAADHAAAAAAAAALAPGTPVPAVPAAALRPSLRSPFGPASPALEQGSSSPLLDSSSIEALLPGFSRLGVSTAPLAAESASSSLSAERPAAEQPPSASAAQVCAHH
jgi:hypothetical protein